MQFETQYMEEPKITSLMQSLFCQHEVFSFIQVTFFYLQFFPWSYSREKKEGWRKRLSKEAWEDRHRLKLTEGANPWLCILPQSLLEEQKALLLRIPS